MPSVMIEPAVPLSTKIGEIKEERNIPHFSSKLHFFDYFILPGEQLSPHTYIGGRLFRPLIRGEQAQFLAKHNLAFPTGFTANAPLGEGLLSTKKSIEDGIFKPYSTSDLKSLEKISGHEIFVSERLAATLTNEKPVLTIEFVDGLPIPPRNWSYEGILDFKSKHYSEYRNFWKSVFDLAVTGEWIEKPDLEMSIRKDVLTGLEEYNRYAAETFTTRLRNSLAINMTVPMNAAFIAAIFGPEGVPKLDLPLTYYFTVAGAGGIRLALGSGLIANR